MNEKERKTIRIAIGGLMTGVLLFCSGVSVGAATNEPGSASDPLITRSYLESQLKGVGEGFQCITLKKGEIIELIQGSQVILYTGSATAQGNLIDTTDGVLCSASGSIARYHAYLVPADGSGFKANSTCVIFLLGKET